MPDDYETGSRVEKASILEVESVENKHETDEADMIRFGKRQQLKVRLLVMSSASELEGLPTLRERLVSRLSSD
jgi:hypothetical protein